MPCFLHVFLSNYLINNPSAHMYFLEVYLCQIFWFSCFIFLQALLPPPVFPSGLVAPSFLTPVSCGHTCIWFSCVYSFCSCSLHDLIWFLAFLVWPFSSFVNKSLGFKRGSFLCLLPIQTSGVCHFPNAHWSSSYIHYINSNFPHQHLCILGLSLVW